MVCRALGNVPGWHLSTALGVFIFRLLSAVLRHDGKVIGTSLRLGKGIKAGIFAFVFPIDVLTSLQKHCFIPNVIGRREGWKCWGSLFINYPTVTPTGENQNFLGCHKRKKEPSLSQWPQKPFRGHVVIHLQSLFVQ